MWYSLAAMHSMAALTPIQKGSRNSPATSVLIPMPKVSSDGNISVAEPMSGMLMPKYPAIAVMATKPTTKKINAYNGFL